LSSAPWKVPDRAELRDGGARCEQRREATEPSDGPRWRRSIIGELVARRAAWEPFERAPP